MARVEHAGQVRVDDLGPLRRRHVRDVGKDADARVVDKNVETAETRDGRGDRSLDLGVGPNVSAKRFDRAGPGGLDQRPGRRKVRLAPAGDRNLHALGDERLRNRQTDAARSSCDDGDLSTQRWFAHVSDYNSPQMHDVAIVGAGELGGALAHILARLDVLTTIRLIDESGSVAEGQALDIMQASPIEAFATKVSGSTDLATAAGAALIVVADRAGLGEWEGEDGMAMLTRLSRVGSRSMILCAGAAQRDLVERGARELRFSREKLFGSAPEALAGAVRALGRARDEWIAG